MNPMDARALLRTLEAERARFLGMARARLACDADAEDVVQRALVRASERADSLAEPERARAWFYRILRRTIIDHHRSRGRDRGHTPLDEVEGTLASADATPGATPRPCACAVHLLDALRPGYGEILRRVDLGGEDAAAVAASLGLTLSNLYVRLHRARRALRERVEGHCGVSSVSPCLDCTCGTHERCGG
jgi:RNA polymerase sigma-70 factor (ECF subfamily)